MEPVKGFGSFMGFFVVSDLVCIGLCEFKLACEHFVTGFFGDLMFFLLFEV